MKNYSYVTLLTNDSYVYGITLLVESMKQVDTKYPLHVMVTDKVSAPTLEMLNELGVTYSEVESIATPEYIFNHNMSIEPEISIIWKECLTKFHVFDMTQYDKIVFLDADLYIMKNLDHLFDLPHMTAALDGEYFGLWQGWPHFNSGCVVIEPSHQLYGDLLNFAANMNPDTLPSYVIADQEILNLYYNTWPEQTELHLNKYYNIFAPYIDESQVEDVKENCYFIHYVGRKPWTFWLRNNNETYAEYWYAFTKNIIETRAQQFDWDKIRKLVKLTVYGICKNEIKNVEAYLKSFSKADYVCLLDTGSTDGTWEYLQQAQSTYPNLIIGQEVITPWRYDAARNESMKLIPKDTTMFFMADLDEVIKEDNWADLVRNSWEPLFDRGMYTYNRDVDKDDNVIRAIPEYRIHSKGWTQWVNIVHEAITTPSGRKQFYVETCTPIDITVWHYPTKNGDTNYMELCEQDLLENPNDYVMRLQLAIEYEIRSEWDKALDHFFYIIEDKNVTLQDFEVARCYYGIGAYLLRNNKEAEALRYFTEGRLYCPTFADNYLAAAQTYFNKQEYQKTIELCLAAFRNCNIAVWCGIYDIKSFLPYYLTGLSYYFINDKIKALGYLSVARIKNNSNDIVNLCNEVAAEIDKEWKD